MDPQTKRHIRDFVLDLKEALETRYEDAIYILRGASKRRGGIRIIILDPNAPIPKNRLKIFRAYRFDRAMERAVCEAFGSNGLNYYLECGDIRKTKGAKNMAGKKLSGKSTPKKVAKKKPSETGVRRKKVNPDGPLTNVCAYTSPSGKSCVQVLKTKRELKAGLCEMHIKMLAEEKKAKTAAKRSASKTAKTKPKKSNGVKTKTAPKGGGGKNRILIMDKYPATLFIRTLASNGLSFSQISDAIKSVHKGKGKPMPADATLRTQIHNGKHNKGGPIIKGDGKVTALIKEYKNK